MAATADRASHEVIEVGPLEILPEEHLARARGRALMLSIRELRLLTELARRADRIMAREELFRLVWGREMRPGDRSVDVYVRKLRVKLEEALPGWRFIHTHFGFGYRLAAEHEHKPAPAVHNRLTTGAPAGADTDGAHLMKETILRKRQITATAVAIAAALVVAACGSSSNSSSSAPAPSGSSSSSSSSSGGSGTINGAGSTFAAPIYQQWGSTLKGQGLTVNYNAVGSGAGVAQLQSATVDFAGSDPAMKPDEVEGREGPGRSSSRSAFGAITVSYNLSGIKSGIKLDGTTLADIFLGKVKTWNDPEITALNPGMSLPSTAITVVHRSDSSGTTKGFTTFLSAYSPAWTAAAGMPDKIVKWPVGTGAKGNSGVAAAIKQTAGAIGYVEQAYALQNGFTYASVKNSSGKFIAADDRGGLRGGRGDQGPAGPRRSRRSTRPTRPRTRSRRRRS